MDFVTKDEFQQKRQSLIMKIAQGAIFIYPSDTIYRIGCDATNEDAVARLRKLKNTTVPFSVVAPSKQWIRQHCMVDEVAEDALDLLPGRYVLVLPVANRNAVAKSTITSDLIGVRIPRHWTHEIASLLGHPIITTSANIAGDDYMKSKSDIHPSVSKVADFCIYDGAIKGAKIQVLDPRSDVLEEV